MLSGGTPSAALGAPRWRTTPWLPDMTVYVPLDSSYIPMAARGSIWQLTMRWLGKSRATTRSAAAKARSVAGASPKLALRQMFPGTSDDTSGAFSCSASSSDATAGSTSYATSIASAASFACASVSAITTATASPT
jgi:hypothetical protein